MDGKCLGAIPFLLFCPRLSTCALSPPVQLLMDPWPLNSPLPDSSCSITSQAELRFPEWNPLMNMSQQLHLAPMSLCAATLKV